MSYPTEKQRAVYAAWLLALPRNPVFKPAHDEISGKIKNLHSKIEDLKKEISVLQASANLICPHQYSEDGFFGPWASASSVPGESRLFHTFYAKCGLCGAVHRSNGVPAEEDYYD